MAACAELAGEVLAEEGAVEVAATPPSPLARDTAQNDEASSSSGGIAEDPMSDDEALAVSVLRDKLAGEGALALLHPHMVVAAESESFYLLRFLRARKLNVDAAHEMVMKNHEWRTEEKISELADKDARDVLGCEVEAIWPYLPCWMQGEARNGQPVIYKEWGNFKYKEISIHTTTPDFVRYHVWMNEMGSRALGRQSLKHGRRIDKFTCIFSAKGWQPFLMKHGAMPFVKEVTAIDQTHYPERLAAIYIINAPRLITMVWSVVRRWLDPVTREKVHILKAEKNWRPLIEAIVDNENLPDIYGGTAPVEKPTGKPILCQTTFSPG